MQNETTRHPLSHMLCSLWQHHFDSYTSGHFLPITYPIMITEYMKRDCSHHSLISCFSHLIFNQTHHLSSKASAPTPASTYQIVSQTLNNGEWRVGEADLSMSCAMQALPPCWIVRTMDSSLHSCMGPEDSPVKLTGLLS